MPDPVWNFEPNWSQDVRETLSWLSTVAGSPAGVEQRMALRSSPRRRLEYAMLLNGPDRAYFNSAIASAGAGDWLLPLWFDAVVLSSSLASGSDEITFATAFREFVAGGKALLRRSLRSYEVVEIATVVSNKITLTDPTVETWPAGTVLYPLRLARLDSDPSLARHADRTEVPSVALQTMEANPWSTSLSVLSTYQGYPVLEQPPDERDTLQTTVTRLLEDLDPSIGLPLYYDTAGAALRVQQHAWMLRGLSENAVFRAFLYACKGRAKALWLPSFQADFDLATGAVSTDDTIEVAHCGYTEFSGASTDNRKDIRISLKDGTSLFRRITSSVDNGDMETLVLSSALGQNIAVSDVHRIEIMALCRLDSDSIEIAHHTDISGASTASISFRSHLSGRSVSPWSPLSPGDTDPGDENTPPDPTGTDNVLARVFTATAFDALYEDKTYPLVIDGAIYDAPEADITFATGAQLSRLTDGADPSVLFLELIATDDTLTPLPEDEQPDFWLVEATGATVRGGVDQSTYLLYDPSHSPVYGGVRLEWPSTFEGPETIVCRGLSPNGTLHVLTFLYRAVVTSAWDRDNSSNKLWIDDDGLTARNTYKVVTHAITLSGGALTGYWSHDSESDEWNGGPTADPATATGGYLPSPSLLSGPYFIMSVPQNGHMIGANFGAREIVPLPSGFVSANEAAGVDLFWDSTFNTNPTYSDSGLRVTGPASGASVIRTNATISGTVKFCWQEYVLAGDPTGGIGNSSIPNSSYIHADRNGVCVVPSSLKFAYNNALVTSPHALSNWNISSKSGLGTQKRSAGKLILAGRINFGTQDIVFGFANSAKDLDSVPGSDAGVGYLRNNTGAQLSSSVESITGAIDEAANGSLVVYYIDTELLKWWIWIETTDRFNNSDTANPFTGVGGKSLVGLVGTGIYPCVGGASGGDVGATVASVLLNTTGDFDPAIPTGGDFVPFDLG